ncbi:GDSL-type esterase/lipase family protein [Saccharophagus degradans]|uniref:GDSL-type esterase/lipase family protein n=1 Tax=Saccharophagus degradans TaxID=86304 RepID=A0AAW7X1Y6_9GAMM|nr:GDSL-type esterase/lipase family protein [Saccharophagus degradans]MDO6421487.1 GDSL-type esterase/lipase family protein [Saccharophagus degradans]MDO6608699.1 GDSL-type esterase/lipase family protein [Saccharophagus degradans]
MPIPPLRTLVICTAASLICALFSACSTLIPQQAPLQTVAPNHPMVTVSGRTQTMLDGSERFGYPGVSFTVNVKAKGVIFNASSTSGNNYLDVYIDGQLQRSIKLEKAATDYVVFNHNRAQQHQVKILNRSESWHGLATLHSIRVQDGKFLAPPAKPRTKLLVIGDSVTCGTGANRKQGCEMDPSWWDAHNSFGMQLGRALNAETHLVCYGGRGVMRSWNGEPKDIQAPAFYDLAVPEPWADAPWDNSKFKADIILVSLGTNDFSMGIPDQQTFINTYVAFATILLRDHPNATIAITDGAILGHDELNKKGTLQNYLKQVQAAVDSPRLAFIPSNIYAGDSCDAHPTGEQHTQMAQDLQVQLEQLLNTKR